jgi:hypothetical protein
MEKSFSAEFARRGQFSSANQARNPLAIMPAEAITFCPRADGRGGVAGFPQWTL